MLARPLTNRVSIQPDVPLFLVLIPLINAYNYYLTYSNITVGWFLVATYLIDTLTGYVAWWSIRTLIFWLDKQILYTNRPLKRIVTQGLLTTVVGLFVIIFSTESLNALVRSQPVPVSFYQYDIFIFVIWFIATNGFYIGFHYYSEWQRTEQLRADEKAIRLEGILVRLGQQDISVPFADIQGFYVDGDYTTLITAQAKKYLLDQSLDKVEQRLPAELFFRLNRQYILNRQVIEGYRRIENGKLCLLVHSAGHFPDVVVVSRSKAPSFKTWFHPV